MKRVRIKFTYGREPEKRSRGEVLDAYPGPDGIFRVEDVIEIDPEDPFRDYKDEMREGLEELSRSILERDLEEQVDRWKFIGGLFPDDPEKRSRYHPST